MFVEHKQLKVLNVPAARVARLNTSGGNVQMLFPGNPPQMCSAYLVSMTNASKILVTVAFYLSESQKSIFFVPKQGDVTVEEAEQVFEEGLDFAESMGFALSETDYHLQSVEDQQKLWAVLPICKLPKKVVEQTGSGNKPAATTVTGDSLEKYRLRSLESLGRFLSSL